MARLPVHWTAVQQGDFDALKPNAGMRERSDQLLCSLARWAGRSEAGVARQEVEDDQQVEDGVADSRSDTA
eukprot:8591323-Alexandrium_andersonii.AAC.1